ncbi:MAG: hypothetical protein HY776_01685 [Actinobacteria bacterium]|nr:hypothetical protein [Actinomycetota bacterium]
MVEDILFLGIFFTVGVVLVLLSVFLIWWTTEFWVGLRRFVLATVSMGVSSVLYAFGNDRLVIEFLAYTLAVISYLYFIGIPTLSHFWEVWRSND